MNTTTPSSDASANLVHQMADANRSIRDDTQFRPITHSTESADDDSWRTKLREKTSEQPRTPDCALYQSRHLSLPLSATCLELCKRYPNHIYGMRLDALHKHGYTAAVIWKLLPDDYKKFLKEVKAAKEGNWNNGRPMQEKVDGEGDANELNLYFKRLLRRESVLKAHGVFDKVLNDPKARPDGRPGRVQPSMTDGDQVSGTTHEQDADIAMIGTATRSAMLDTTDTNANALSGSAHIQVTATADQPPNQTSTQPCATQQPQQAAPINSSNPAGSLQRPTMLPQPQIPNAIGAVLGCTSVELPVYLARDGRFIKIVPGTLPHGHISNVPAIADPEVRDWCFGRDVGSLETRCILVQPDGNIHEIIFFGRAIGLANNAGPRQDLEVNNALQRNERSTHTPSEQANGNKTVTNDPTTPASRPPRNIAYT